MPPAPVYEGPVSAEALRDRIAFSGMPGMRSEVEASLWKGRKRVGAFKGAIVMRPPDDMRIVLYDTFGNTVMDIVRANGSLEVLVPSKNTLYLGHAPSMMPAADSGMTMSIVEEMDGEKAYELSSMKEGRAEKRYRFDARSALNTGASVMGDDGKLIEARFTDYLPGRVGNIPGRVVIAYGKGLRIELTIKDPELSEVPSRLIPLGRTASRIYDISELEAAE